MKIRLLILRVLWILGIIIGLLFTVLGFLHNFVLVNLEATPLMSWTYGPGPMFGGVLWALFFILSYNRVPIWLAGTDEYSSTHKKTGWRFLKLIGYLITFFSLGLLMCMDEVEKATQILYVGSLFLALASTGMILIYLSNKRLKRQNSFNHLSP